MKLPLYNTSSNFEKLFIFENHLSTNILFQFHFPKSKVSDLLSFSCEERSGSETLDLGRSKFRLIYKNKPPFPYLKNIHFNKGQEKMYHSCMNLANCVYFDRYQWLEMIWRKLLKKWASFPPSILMWSPREE